MSSLTHAFQHQATNATLWARLSAHFSKIDAAHAKKARFAMLSEYCARDSGLSPEDFMAELAYDPALPFFMQSGFDRR